MDALIEVWNSANKLLVDYPLIPILATILISGLSLFLPRVRETAKRYVQLAWSWIKDRWQRAMVRSCGALGIARLEDLNRIQNSIDEKFRQTTGPARTNSTQTPVPRTINRLGIKLRLDETIMNYLGRLDPRRVDSRTIDRLLQGPFCKKCSYLLTEWRSQLGADYVRAECPNCKHRWNAFNDPIKLYEFKEKLYRDLDAEVQRTNNLVDSDGWGL
jgi:hypothetical protein